MGQQRMTENYRAYRIIQAKLADYTLDEIAVITRKYKAKMAAITEAKQRRTRDREECFGDGIVGSGTGSGTEC